MLNKWVGFGRITRDLELKATASGVNVLNFTVAVTRSYCKQGEERQSDFINCVAFRNTAEHIAKWFKKGSLIAIDGSIQTRTWDDTDGRKHYATEVMVNEAHFVESKKQTEEKPELPQEVNANTADEDDLPFNREFAIS